MALQFSTSLRNALAEIVESHIGTSATLEIRTGAPPANCAAASTGAILATISLPADWLTAGSGGVVSKNGTWQDLSVDASGVAAHYRIFAGATCHLQGTVTATGGGGDLEVDNTNFAAGQVFTVTAFSLTAPGA